MSLGAFEGVKVLDFTWIGVGPLTTKYLADHGATVIKVESATHPDGVRINAPLKDKLPGMNRSGFFTNFNSSKYGATLNLNHPKGLEIAKRMVQWADVVTESYTPRAMRKWGLDYENLAKLKPDIIMYSTCQQGQTGPYRDYAGYGNQGAALAGFHHMTSWPDRPPAGPHGAYTDVINPRLGAFALAVALSFRKRTGRGTHIDLSQIEGGLQFLAPAILDYSANGRCMEPMGNRSSNQAPHGVFPCQGEERWIAIEVEGDQQWEALQRVLGEPTWARAEQFGTIAGRLANVDDLEEALAAATASWDAYQLMYALQAAGVSAGVVQRGEDLFSDPQLEYRKHFWHLEHTEIGRHAYDGPAFRLSKTPGELRLPGPCLGEHNELVYRTMIGMNGDEYQEALEEGAFE